MSSKSINSRMAAQRSHSLTRRWSSGSGTRRRSGRGGKSGPRPAAHFALLALVHFQPPHQKTIAQHDGDSVPMKAIQASSLILIPAQLGFSFLMILLDPVAAVGILDHLGQRHGGREITPEILPVPVLAACGALPNQPPDMAGAIAIHPPAAQCAKLGPPPALGPFAPCHGLPVLARLRGPHRHRLPADDNVERNMTELLRRPPGRPSYRPMVRYKSFLYQAASWPKARRVVAKV
jgi:hypothetical protein